MRHHLSHGVDLTVFRSSTKASVELPCTVAQVCLHRVRENYGHAVLVDKGDGVHLFSTAVGALHL